SSGHRWCRAQSSHPCRSKLEWTASTRQVICHSLAYKGSCRGQTCEDQNRGVPRRALPGLVKWRELEELSKFATNAHYRQNFCPERKRFRLQRRSARRSSSANSNLAIRTTKYRCSKTGRRQVAQRA